MQDLEHQTDDLDLLLAEAPKWPKVVGILSIVWGAFGLLCGGTFTVLGLVVGPRMMENIAKSQNVPAPPSPHYPSYFWPLAGLSFALAALLIVAGILTLARSRKGRLLHLIYAVVSIPMVLFSTYVNIQVQNDLKERMATYAQENPKSPFAQGQTGPAADIGRIVGPAIGLAIGLPWPLFCLLWFTLSKRGTSSMKGTGLEPAA